jgi:predicted nuclease of predicted toxin-antitoxin system
MNLSEFSLLADQNIHSDVVAHLRECQFDIVSVADLRLQGANDLTLIRLAFNQQRVVVTHDPDFGTLAILQGEPIVGILFLRPGHIRAEFTNATIDSVLSANLDVTPPFIVVAQRTVAGITIRVRQL